MPSMTQPASVRAKAFTYTALFFIASALIPSTVSPATAAPIASANLEYCRPFGYVDGVNGNGVVTGWAIDPCNVTRSVTIQYFVDNKREVFAVSANKPRSDVGAHGFETTLPGKYRDGKFHRVFAFSLDRQDSNRQWQLFASPLRFRLGSVAVAPTPTPTPTPVPTATPAPSSVQGLPVRFHNSGRRLPESATVTVSVPSIPANSTKAILTLRAFDPDRSSEGEVWINNKNNDITLFGSQGLESNQEITRDVRFEMPASWWRVGSNTLTFTHTKTNGYEIRGVSVAFGN